MTRLDLEFRDGLSPGITAMIKRAEDLTPAMQAIADYMEFSTRQRFETGKAPNGTPWKPSQRALGRDANADGSAGKTLVKRGHLLASIDRAFGPNSATVGTNVVYARRQQMGDTGTVQVGAHTRKIKSAFGKPLPNETTVNVRPYSLRSNLPARPYIGFSTEDETEIYEILRDHLSGEQRA